VLGDLDDLEEVDPAKEKETVSFVVDLVYPPVEESLVMNLVGSIEP